MSQEWKGFFEIQQTVFETIRTNVSQKLSKRVRLAKDSFITGWSTLAAKIGTITLRGGLGGSQSVRNNVNKWFRDKYFVKKL